MTTDGPDVEAIERPSTITCPGCSASMEKVTFKNIEIDRCTSCRGLWLDMLEREKLDRVKGSQAVDTGPENSKKRDESERIDCPVCHEPMIRMTDLKKRDIRYDSCPVCYGVFYDAGDFRKRKAGGLFGFLGGLFGAK